MGDCPRTYLQACLLLLIAEQPDHGYDLAARIESLGIADPDAACTYRALRGLERDGAVVSSWAPSGSGPARRVYQVTGHGWATLAAEGHELRREQLRIARYLHRLDAASAARRRVRPASVGRLPVAEGGSA